MGKKFLDTNAILTDCSDLSNAVISSKTIEELENIKTNSHKDDEIKFKAKPHKPLKISKKKGII